MIASYFKDSMNIYVSSTKNKINSKMKTDLLVLVQVLVMQSKKSDKCFIFHTWIETWVTLSYLWDTAQWPPTTLNLLTSPSAAFSILQLYGPILVERLFFCCFCSWITKQEEQIYSSSCLVSALQTFVSHSVPRDCPTPTPASRRIMFTLFSLAQIPPGQKIQTGSERYLALWIGFKYFYYLSDDTSAVSVWFS